MSDDKDVPRTPPLRIADLAKHDDRRGSMNSVSSTGSPRKPSSAELKFGKKEFANAPSPRLATGSPLRVDDQFHSPRSGSGGTPRSCTPRSGSGTPRSGNHSPRTTRTAERIKTERQESFVSLKKGGVFSPAPPLIAKSPSETFEVITKQFKGLSPAPSTPGQSPQDPETRRLIAFHTAIRSGNVEKVESLLPHADINAVSDSGNTAIHLAVANAHLTCLKLLLARKDLNVNVRDKLGETALLRAIRSNTELMAAALLDAGADTNIGNRERVTPLEWASYNRKTDLCRLLLKHGAKVDKTDKQNKTALHWAAEHGDEDTCVALLEANASLEMHDSQGDTPLLAAAKRNHLQIVRLLLHLGGDPMAANNCGEWPALFIPRTILEKAAKANKMREAEDGDQSNAAQ
eukprot:GFYU01004195.1.p1 GENE.GFYU01004195.1~~GFYU01004195.1.p1  ORF type:complete len:404 (-),score=112.00 GFYU01004195.1:66-1277(-)